MKKFFSFFIVLFAIFGFTGFVNPSFAMTCPEEGVCSDPDYKMVVGTNCPLTHEEVSRATRCDPTKGTCSGFTCIVGAPGTPPEPTALLCKLADGFRIQLTDMPAGSTFSFRMTASGDFTVDWGDGQPPQVINKTDTDDEVFTSGTYTTAGNRVVTIRGLATGYHTVTVSPISFGTSWPFFNPNPHAYRITNISGDLGQIFPILHAGLDGTPRFANTFRDLTGLTSIPENLFAGINGPPASAMFIGTFANTNITSIPENLFASISGSPAASIFAGTFQNTNITSIPENLFASISGPPANSMFHGTFENTNITSIPENLFASISGPPADWMFTSTFQNTPITSIPENLFASISGPPAAGMFLWTFRDSNITSIPANLFANINGPPAVRMFEYTFGNTNITSIPDNLFAGISGPPESGMFRGTFYNATSLTGPSARINGQFLYEIWPTATTPHVERMYRNAIGLSDWGSIPLAWR